MPHVPTSEALARPKFKRCVTPRSHSGQADMLCKQTRQHSSSMPKASMHHAHSSPRLCSMMRSGGVDMRERGALNARGHQNGPARQVLFRSGSHKSHIHRISRPPTKSASEVGPQSIVAVGAKLGDGSGSGGSRLEIAMHARIWRGVRRHGLAMTEVPLCFLRQ